MGCVIANCEFVRSCPCSEPVLACEAAPGLLARDSTIVGASDAYLHATLTQREEIVAQDQQCLVGQLRRRVGRYRRLAEIVADCRISAIVVDCAEELEAEVRRKEIEQRPPLRRSA